MRVYTVSLSRNGFGQSGRSANEKQFAKALLIQIETLRGDIVFEALSKLLSASGGFAALASPALLVAAISSTSIKTDCRQNPTANEWSRRKEPNIFHRGYSQYAESNLVPSLRTGVRKGSPCLGRFPFPVF